MRESATREQLGERTLALCQIPSPLGEADRIAEHVARITGGERIGNAVVCGRVTGSRPAVILAGHLDTVPIQEGDFPARRVDGRVHGRGASDMKGALVVMIELWNRMPRHRLPVEVIISSGFLRADETARYIVEAVDKPLEQSDLFAERRHPSFPLGRSKSEPDYVAFEEGFWN